MNIYKLNLIILVIVVLAAGSFAWGLLVPGVKELRVNTDRVAQESEAIERAQNRVGDVTGLYSSLMALNDELSTFHRQLPADRNMGEFLNSLSRCLGQSEIPDFTIQPSPAVEVDAEKLPEHLSLARGITVLPVTISFETRFEDTFRFMTCLEQLERLARVESMKLTNLEHNPGDVLVDIILHVYHKPS